MTNPNHDEKGRFADAGKLREAIKGAIKSQPGPIPGDPQPRATAYLAGRDAFLAGHPENTPHSFVEDADAFLEGYKVARKHARFNATIEARRAKKNA